METWRVKDHDEVTLSTEQLANAVVRGHLELDALARPAEGGSQRRLRDILDEEGLDAARSRQEARKAAEAEALAEREAKIRTLAAPATRRLSTTVSEQALSSADAVERWGWGLLVLAVLTGIVVIAQGQPLGGAVLVTGFFWRDLLKAAADLLRCSAVTARATGAGGPATAE